jgi:hypothetical protein
VLYPLSYGRLKSGNCQFSRGLRSDVRVDPQRRIVDRRGPCNRCVMVGLRHRERHRDRPPARPSVKERPAGTKKTG